MTAADGRGTEPSRELENADRGAAREPLARKTLSVQVAERITDHILSNALKPGAEIPPESELAERFGVSRLVVREAIRMLSAQEVLLVSQGRQAKVAVPSARVLGELLRFRVRQESLDFADLMTTRQLIEAETARRAAERVVEAGVSSTELEEALAAMKEHRAERESFIAFDVAFHRAIARMAGNSVLELLLDAMEDILREARRASWQGRMLAEGQHESTVAAHAAILEAIRRGDPDGASAAMRAHLETTERDLGGLG